LLEELPKLIIISFGGSSKLFTRIGKSQSLDIIITFLFSFTFL